MADSTQIGGGGPVLIEGTFQTTGTGNHTGQQSYTGLQHITNTTDAAAKTTNASLRTDGGIAVAKKVHAGTGITTDAGGITVTAGGITVTAGGIHDKNVTVQSGTAAEDLTSTARNLTWYTEAAQAAAITLPQATAGNVGMVITVLYGANAAAGSDHKLGFANGGSTVMVGQLSLGALDAAAGDENRSFALASSCKALVLDASGVSKAGGAAGSKYVFHYIAANKVFVEARGLVTTGTPGPTADASSGTGI